MKDTLTTRQKEALGRLISLHLETVEESEEQILFKEIINALDIKQYISDYVQRTL